MIYDYIWPNQRKIEKIGLLAKYKILIRKPRTKERGQSKKMNASINLSLLIEG